MFEACSVVLLDLDYVPRLSLVDCVAPGTWLLHSSIAHTSKGHNRPSKSGIQVPASTTQDKRTIF